MINEGSMEINKITVAYCVGDIMFISRQWLKEAGIKHVKMAEGIFNEREHRI